MKDGRGGPQIIPRPRVWHPGAPNPWTDRLTHQDVQIDRVELALKRVGTEPLPPELRTALRPPLLSTSSTAAVLVPLFVGDQGETRVLLTRRSTRLRTHSGEVAFPGGRVDAGETLEQAALREAHEEVDLPPSHVRIIGRLESLSTAKNRTAITPIVGVVNAMPELRPSPVEVDRIFDVALLDLIHPDCFREETWQFPDAMMAVYFFEVPGDTIWGATGRMLHRLLSLLVEPHADSLP